MGKIAMIAAVLAVTTAQVANAAPAPVAPMQPAAVSGFDGSNGQSYRHDGQVDGRHGLSESDRRRIFVELLAAGAVLWGLIAAFSHHRGPNGGTRPTSP